MSDMMTEEQIRRWIAQLEAQSKAPTPASTFAEQAEVQANRRAIALKIGVLRQVIGER